MTELHGTTILSVRRNGVVAVGGDGQVSLGNTVMKGNARKVRRLYDGKVLAGFAGGTADAFTLFERFEAKLQQYGNLTRAAIELAKDWRTDRSLRRLEALLCVADAKSSFIVSGNGDVIEPEDDIMAIGSGGALRTGRGARAAAEHRARRPRTSSRRRWASPRTSASTPTATHDRGSSLKRLAPSMSHDPPRNRPGARQAHRRAERGQARGRDRAAQPLAPHAGRPRACAPRSRRRTS